MEIQPNTPKLKGRKGFSLSPPQEKLGSNFMWNIIRYYLSYDERHCRGKKIAFWDEIENENWIDVIRDRFLTY